MRWLIVIFAVILLAAGALLGLVYPKAMENAAGREIGRWTVYDGGGDFVARDATLWQSDGPTLVTVRLSISGPLQGGAEREVLTLAALDGGGSEVARAVLAFPATGTLESPQTGIVRYDQTVRLLEPATGPHSFIVSAGRDFPASAASVELVLNAGTYHVQPNARPVGIGLMAFGALGLWLGLRSRRENPNSQPPSTRWGRG